jgi:Ca2+-binding RTX toxin-like protein
VQGDKLQQVLNVNQINFYGGNGADKVWNNTNISSKLLGYSGNDELHGGSAHDEIQGGLGSDKIYGGAGYNYLWANGPSQGGSDPSAMDYVYGEKGADDIYGGYKQVNFLFGGDGNAMDHLHGGDASTNYLFGGEGNDVLYGGGKGAINFLYGGAGDDWMIGGSAKFGESKVFNQMIDDEGKDTFVGGNRAYNYMNAVDGGVPGQQDVMVPGVINSIDLIYGDANDTVWDFSNGPYPVSPP